jgi:hypothetical protein
MLFVQGFVFTNEEKGEGGRAGGRERERDGERERVSE